MTDNLQPTHLPSEPTRLAPWLHTLAIVALFLLWVCIGRQRAQSQLQMPHLFHYTWTAMTLWMMLGAVVAGLYHRREFFYITLQRNARPMGLEFLRALGIVTVAFIAQTAIQALPVFHHKFDTVAIQSLVPNTILELLLWLLVAISAGFCEEHAFRGYLLPQCTVALRTIGTSPRLASALAVFATSLLFGSLHLYQGLGGALVTMLLGVINAVCFLWFGNLRAVALAHALQDSVAMIVLFIQHTHAH